MLRIGLFKQPKNFKDVTRKLWGGSLPAVLDFRGNIYRQVSRGSRGACIAIIGPDGNYLVRAGLPEKGSSYYKLEGGKTERAPYYLMRTELEKHKDKGLLGGLALPAGAGSIKGALKRAACSEALEAALGRNDDFGKTLAGRLETLQSEKKALFDKLVASEDCFEAYRVGSSYVRCFPGAPDGGEVKAALADLRSKDGYRRNLAAQKSFEKKVHSLIKVKTNEDFKKGSDALASELQKDHPETKVAELVK